MASKEEQFETARWGEYLDLERRVTKELRELQNEKSLVFTPPVVLLERCKGMRLSNSLYSIWSGLKYRILLM
jgi:hypothetical protein